VPLIQIKGTGRGAFMCSREGPIPLTGAAATGGMGEQHRVVLGQAAPVAVGRAFGIAPPASGRGSGQSSRP